MQSNQIKNTFEPGHHDTQSPSDQPSGGPRHIRSHKTSLPGFLARWIWRHPLLLILLAHSVFSIGIWNARDGYVEDTNNIVVAYRILQSHHADTSVYIDLLALMLRVMPDPVTALTFLKYLSSLLATVALYLGLSCFSKQLRPGAIIFACLLWIASSLNAPFLVTTSLSLFTFAIILFGFDCLLLNQSIKGLVGFYFFGVVSAMLRPEYFLPVVLMTLILAGWALSSASKRVELRLGWPHYWTWAVGTCLVLVAGAALWFNPPKPLIRVAVNLDDYALYGLGQCYADFYHRGHPKEVFDPMTEYQAILDRTFNKPAGFCAAIRNNPWEALRYFAINGTQNLLSSVPKSLLDRYREQKARYSHGVLYWVVRIVLISGALLGVRRWYRAGWKGTDFSIGSISALAKRSSTGRKLLLLILLLSTSSVAIVLLVGSARYFYCWTPLFYLGVAYCADSLLRALNLLRFETLCVAVSFIIICSPNYLAPRPNHEFEAVRHVAAYVKDLPTVAAWWSEPDAVLALKGKARAISIWDGIHQADIVDGKIDILMIDPNFRGSKTWVDQQEFFEQFERQPEKCGFKKATDIPTGRFAIYYKPNLVQKAGQ